MADRRWTVMVVPHGSDSPRSFAISERAVRAAAYTGAVLGLVAVIGIGSAIASAGRVISGIIQPAEANAMASTKPRDVNEVALRVASLRDTLEVIRKREAQIRLLAGLPATDSGANATPATIQLALSSDSAARPESIHADVETLIQRADLLSARFAAVTDSLEINAKRLSSVPSIMPTAGWLTSQFSRNRKHPILHVTRPHEGIDVTAPMGAPIVAPASGVVKRVARETGYGNVLEIDHGNGIVTRYAHTSRIDVRRGQRVTRGQTIAAVGKTGLSTGPHLHYEIHVNGKVVDPLTYVLPDVIPD
ncbi:MAG TPA: M23 family metallopeptidase [Gemmatimonadaceae bacterium]|jgi:murein DD-endopeptidase MepM/ murein hydrolase activator NlpD|nr:M23 family metallopeptidase [Gemmatimonadaceae bacterium]